MDLDEIHDSRRPNNQVRLNRCGFDPNGYRSNHVWMKKLTN